MAEIYGAAQTCRKSSRQWGLGDPRGRQTWRGNRSAQDGDACVSRILRLHPLRHRAGVIDRRAASSRCRARGAGSQLGL
jgi:hypothetical protein